MTDMDLEAIKARALAAKPGPWRVTEEGITNLTPDKDEHDQIAEIVTMHPSDVALLEISDEDAAHIAGMDPETTLALVDRIERLKDAWAEAVISAETSGEWAAIQLEDLRDRMTITDDMVERARRAMYRELNGQYGDFTTPTIGEARAVLEAALKEDQ